MIDKAYRLFTVLLREQIKEPIVLFWNMLVPSIMFMMVMARGTDSGEAAFSIGLVLAYSCWTTVLYSSGIVLLARREGGFLKTFAPQKDSLRIVLLAHVLVVFTLGVCSTLLIALLYAVTAPELFIAKGIGDLFTMLYWILLGTFGSIGVLAVRLSFRSAATVANIALFGMILVHFGASAAAWPINVVSYINPLSVVAQSIDGITLSTSYAVIGLSILLITIGTAGLKYSRFGQS